MTALPAVNVPRPLDNFPLLRSANAKEVRDAFARIYAKPALVTTPRADSLNAVMNNCRLQGVELAFGAFGAEVGLDFPTSGLVAQIFPLQGRARVACGAATSVDVAAGAGCLLSSHAPHRMDYSADYAHLVLRVDARVLTEKLQSMIGAPLDQPLRIDTQKIPNGPAARMLQHYLPLLIKTISQNDPPFPDGWIAQTEQLLLTLLLCGYRHNYSRILDQLASDVTPREVRLAEEYIEANIERAITLEELAEIAGTNTFSLFRAFRMFRGYSPFTFVSQARLKSGALRR
jgi:AraC-binding-like domain